MKQKIAITGGHLTPALAVMEELMRRGYRLVFFGRSTTMTNDPTPSIEKEVISGIGIRFLSITAGRWSRHNPLLSLLTLGIETPQGFAQALTALSTAKPDLILSFGGYLAVPVVLAGAVRGVPVVMHEQTRVTGIANRLLSWFAKEVLVSFPETARGKARWIGNPVRKAIFQTRPRSQVIQEWLAHNPRFLYVTGGNQGAHALNIAVEEVLSELLSRWPVFHQTGDSAQFRDLDRMTAIREGLPEPLKRKYFVTRYVHAEDVGAVMRHSHVVIARAGANTVWELALLRKRSVLVPLATSGGGEQQYNASWLASSGLGIVLPDNPSGEMLLGSIAGAHKLVPEKAVVPDFIDAAAASRIADRIDSLFQ